MMVSALACAVFLGVTPSLFAQEVDSLTPATPVTTMQRVLAPLRTDIQSAGTFEVDANNDATFGTSDGGDTVITIAGPSAESGKSKKSEKSEKPEKEQAKAGAQKQKKGPAFGATGLAADGTVISNGSADISASSASVAGGPSAKSADASAPRVAESRRNWRVGEQGDSGGTSPNGARDDVTNGSNAKDGSSARNELATRAWGSNSKDLASSFQEMLGDSSGTARKSSYDVGEKVSSLLDLNSQPVRFGSVGGSVVPIAKGSAAAKRQDDEQQSSKSNLPNLPPPPPPPPAADDQSDGIKKSDGTAAADDPKASEAVDAAKKLFDGKKAVDMTWSNYDTLAGLVTKFPEQAKELAENYGPENGDFKGTLNKLVERYEGVDPPLAQSVRKWLEKGNGFVGDPAQNNLAMPVPDAMSSPTTPPGPPSPTFTGAPTHPTLPTRPFSNGGLSTH